MAFSPSDTPIQQAIPVGKPNWTMALASCLAILPLGLLITYTPIFLQDRANTATFTTVVLQTALFAGISFRLAAWIYRRIAQHILPLQSVLAGAFSAALLYIVVFYAVGLLMPFARMTAGATVADLETLSDPLLWLEAMLAWPIAQLLGFGQAFRPLRPAEPRMSSVPMRPSPAVRGIMLGLIALTLLSLLAVIVLFR